jgi:hypothetical protein
MKGRSKLVKSSRKGSPDRRYLDEFHPALMGMGINVADSDIPMALSTMRLYSPVRTRECVYRFRQLVDTASTTQVAGSETDGALVFQLVQLSNVTAFTSIFDQYRIDMVQVSFSPRVNAAVPTSPTGTIMPKLYTGLDYDDASTTTIAALLDYQSLVITPPCMGVVRTVKPRIAIAAYSGAFTSFANQESWVDCGSTAVQHYGLKYAVEAGLVGQLNLQQYTITAVYFIAFRNVK